MKIFRDISVIPEQCNNAVVVLGNFDGFHLGHRSIVKAASDIARTDGCRVILMSFEPHPREFFLSKAEKGERREGLRIYSLRSKLSQVKLQGIEYVILARFNEQFASVTAEDFVKNILVDKLQARYVVTGENFYFGKNRQGDKKLLANLAEKFSFKYLASPHIVDDSGKLVSSSSIRELLRSGQMEEAAKLLAMPYHIEGRVVRGEGRGQKLGFPTANISLAKLFLPKFGVYALRVRIDGQDKVYNAVANLGVKPTFGVNSPLLEVHLLDECINLYGKRICVEFVQFIRVEQKFSSIDILKEQIAMDCKQAGKILD